MLLNNTRTGAHMWRVQIITSSRELGIRVERFKHMIINGKGKNEVHKPALRALSFLFSEVKSSDEDVTTYSELE